ncbi:30S ribosomal protein S9 [Candidatus Jorgensenbacteria bacterium GWA1_54_12]|uniref:30S ribosomal protein S9 n=1 Tax=Candidatus Jorgensenbacteria bacterium GWA1_54_12 TaxID=1798468 RepID=A0A1F6BLI8_9BACT|nr:MAG: 30S ribosomal protein S9 [Candidatus Jorgensenbacteria bacterium GWA1_54_12]
MTKTHAVYIEGVGRRKTATARVRIYPHAREKKVEVNEKAFEAYFPFEKQRKTVLAPFEVLGKRFAMTVQVRGGGVMAQAEAVRHGLTRALEKNDPDVRKTLKPYGFFTRDPRKKERKKPGLRGARRPQQWRKR